MGCVEIYSANVTHFWLKVNWFYEFLPLSCLAVHKCKRLFTFKKEHPSPACHTYPYIHFCSMACLFLCVTTECFFLNIKYSSGIHHFREDGQNGEAPLAHFAMMKFRNSWSKFYLQYLTYWCNMWELTICQRETFYFHQSHFWFQDNSVKVSKCFQL